MSSALPWAPLHSKPCSVSENLTKASPPRTSSRPTGYLNGLLKKSYVIFRFLPPVSSLAAGRSSWRVLVIKPGFLILNSAWLYWLRGRRDLISGYTNLSVVSNNCHAGPNDRTSEPQQTRHYQSLNVSFHEYKNVTDGSLVRRGLQGEERDTERQCGEGPGF